MNALRRFVLLLLASFLFAIACQPNPQEATFPDAGRAVPVSIKGAGATFPLFLYQRWFSEYRTWCCSASPWERICSPNGLSIAFDQRG